ncbi:outer membrane protein assembly factor BamA [candidate division WOR-3 bacterium]|nr:outer membrane protein assembly factor BamA [candidate division WOR-3 bacterium]
MVKLKGTQKIICLLFTVYWLLPTLLWSEIIVDLKAEGVKNVDPGLIIAASGLEIGDELTPDAVTLAIQRVYSLGLFEDVKINREKEGGGARITVVVKECPIISRIEFEGNKKFKDKKLLEICGLKEGAIGSGKAIFDGEVKIRKAYEEKGHYLVKIEDSISESNGELKIKYLISEGWRVKIRKIEILGNRAFTDKKLEGKLKNKEKCWYRSGNFNREEFEEDPGRIIEFYKDCGWPSCKIADVRVVSDNEVGSGKEWLNIYIEIDEGKKFLFGEIAFEGNKVLGIADLIDEIKFKTYEPYSKDKLMKSLQGIYELYGDRGYLYVSVEPVEEVRDSLIDITCRIREGNPARIHKIIIQDNTKTHDKVIRRELTIFPGDILSRKELIRSQRKVFNLGFFKNITLDTRRVNDQGDIDLILKVEEKPAGQASLGASFYPKYGFVGNVMYSTPNFRGRGEHLYINFQKGEKLQTLQIGYHKPWVFDTPLGVGLDLFNTTESRYWYDTQRTGGSIKLSRPIPRLPFAKGYVSYKLERVHVTSEDTAYLSSYIKESLGKQIRSVSTFEFIRDSRDNFLNPTLGTRNDIRLELSGGILGGSVDYHKEIFETSIYHKVLWRTVLGLRGKFGIVEGYDARVDVPLYERFVLGGMGSWGLRGYSDWSIGPKKEGEIIGGKFASLFTVELKWAFEENMYPLIFFDAGNAWECAKEANFQDLKRSVGMGVRIEIPMMGLVGFDFGYGIDKEPKSWGFHLQMGRTF